MPSHLEAPRRLGALAPIVLMFLIAACAAVPEPSTSGSPSVASASPSATATPPAPPPSATGAPSGPAGLDLPAPGRPFDAAAILTILRGSQRPDGVAPELRTEAAASAVADAIWTFDGRPWTTSDATGTCGPDICTLEIAGTRPDNRGDDLWVFEVDRASSTVEVRTAVLQGFPAELVDELDALAHSIAPAGTLDGALLTGVRWLPASDAGGFVLSYRTGGEEGSCAADVTIDAVAPEFVDMAVRDC